MNISLHPVAAQATAKTPHPAVACVFYAGIRTIMDEMPCTKLE